MGKQAANPMDAHLEGRGTQRGPMAGSYVSFTLSKEVIGAGLTDQQVGVIVLPFDFRIHEISLSCTSSAGGASRATIQVTDGVNDLFSADRELVSGGAVRVGPNTAIASLVEAQRTRAAGDFLFVEATTVAAEVVDDPIFVITGHVRGHVHSDPADD